MIHFFTFVTAMQALDFGLWKLEIFRWFTFSAADLSSCAFGAVLQRFFGPTWARIFQGYVLHQGDPQQTRAWAGVALAVGRKQSDTTDFDPETFGA